MYIGFIQEIHWVNASTQKRNQFCGKLYKKIHLVFIERCRKGGGQILTNNNSSSSSFRKKVVLLTMPKEKQYTAQ